ncbi:MAG: adenylate/guanylate cyclase domain-containing protein [Armatimonadetes bacterium]|nr:adenylate/guanylate cyclase domain-containing protein [Armatimonadota bacterium]
MSEVAAPAQGEVADLAGPAEWSGFAAHIRSHPSSLAKSAGELSREFGLPEEFIGSFLAAMRAPVQQESFLEVGARAVRESFRAVGRAVGNTFRELTAKPWLCHFGTILAIFGVIALLTIFRTAWGLGTNFVYTGAAGALLGSVTVLGVMMQAVAYYRHAQIRYAVVMTAFVFLCWTGLMFALVNEAGRSTLEERDIPANPVLILAAGLLALFYFVFAVISTLAGSYSQYRKDSRQEVEVTRQELLDRLFHVESRLASADPTRGLRRVRWVDRLRTARTFYLNVVISGVAVGMFEVAVIGTLTKFTGRPMELPQMSIPLILFTLTILAAKCALALIYGFVAGRPGRSMSAIAALMFGIWISYWFPLGNYGPKFAMGMLNPGTVIQDSLLILVFGSLIGYAAEIEDRNYRQSRLGEDDIPTLLAEQVQLHWRLGLGQQATTVMVVDVAKSTVMKANAEPLKVEWSFREFQAMVDEVSRSHGGHVLSTAGDGAVVGFDRPDLAMLAARELQTMMPKFNMSKNRLDQPFRIRIGIHAGQTESSLADAPFNEVIDIAAHIEAVSPVGGIAVSQAVAEALDDGIQLAEMARPVDGQAVSVVLNPTLER